MAVWLVLADLGPSARSPWHRAERPSWAAIAAAAAATAVLADLLRRRLSG